MAQEKPLPMLPHFSREPNRSHKDSTKNEQMIELDYPHHSWLLISALQFRTIAATWSKVGEDAKELIFISCVTFTFSSLVILYNNGPATVTVLTNKMHIDSATLHYVFGANFWIENSFPFFFPNFTKFRSVLKKKKEKEEIISF